MLLLVATGVVEVLLRMMLLGETTLVDALPQLLVVHEALGVAGEVPPEGSTLT